MIGTRSIAGFAAIQADIAARLDPPLPAPEASPEERALVALAAPEPGKLLPVLHERHDQTHLLRLVIGLNVTDPAAAQTFDPALLRTLGADELFVVRAEAAGLHAASQLARRIVPALSRKIAEDRAPLLEAVASLDEPWRSYYPAVVGAGLQSLVFGMGIGGFTEPAAAAEGGPAASVDPSAARRHLASPLAAALICLAIAAAARRDDPIAALMRTLAVHQNRYGLSFSGIPGRAQVPFPAGGEPPEEIAGRVRTCAGMPYVEGVLAHGHAWLAAALAAGSAVR